MQAFKNEEEPIRVYAYGFWWREATSDDRGRYDIDRLHRQEIVASLGDIPCIVRVSGCLAIFGTRTDARDMIRIS